jgi:hypothetical protein
MSFEKATAEIFEVRDGAKGNLIIIHKSDNRQFVIKGDKKYKFSAYGFGGLNAKKIIYERVRANDFHYAMDKTTLSIEFEIMHKQRTHSHEMVCEEIFDLPANISTMEFNMIADADKERIFNNLLRKVSNLEERVKELTGSLTSMRGDARRERIRNGTSDAESVGYCDTEDEDI